MRSVTAAKTRSGAAGSMSRAAIPVTELQVVDTIHQVPAVSINQPQVPTAPVATGEDMVSLLQQSVNLSSLLTLLSSNQQPTTGIFNQQTQMLNPTFAENTNNSSIQPQIPLGNTTDMNQMLQQLSVSAALLRASGAMQTQPTVQVPASVILSQNMPTTAPWWINANIQAAPLPQSHLLQQPHMPGWPATITLPIANLPSIPQNVAEQERLRGVMDTFVRYCETVQQQQVAPRPPPPAPGPPPPDKNQQP